MSEVGSESIHGILKSTLKNLNYDLAQNIISYKSPPSLECISFNRITVFLWHQYEMVEKNYLPALNLYDDWLPPIKEELSKKVSHLQVPKSLKEALKERIEFIAQDVNNFLFYPIYSMRIKQKGFPPFQGNEFINIKSCFDSICWTYQGTINRLKTAEIILENPNLSTRDKYIIACNNCLEEKINDLRQQLPDDFINNYNSEDERLKLVLYWTYNTKRKCKTNILMNKENRLVEASNNNDMFKWAVRNNNEVAMQYFYKNFADEEMQISLTECALHTFANGGLGSLDRICYMILQMNETQMDEFFGFDSGKGNLFYRYFKLPYEGYVYELIRRLLNNYVWQNVFLSAAKDILKMIEKVGIFNSLVIVCDWNESVFEINQNKILFAKILDIYDHDIRVNFNCLFVSNFYALIDKDIEIIKSFLSKGTNDEKLKIMHSEREGTGGIYFCEDLIIYDGNLDNFNLIITEMLACDEEINKFKKFFVDKRGLDICTRLISYDKYETIDKFLKMFIGEEKIKSFKQELPSRDDQKIIIALRKKFPDLQSYINKFLSWCFDGNEEMVANFKEKISI